MIDFSHIFLLTLTLTLVKLRPMKLFAARQIAVHESHRARGRARNQLEPKQEAFRDWLRVRRHAVKRLELREWEGASKTPEQGLNEGRVKCLH
jgi:hypothetical protein